MFFTRTDDGDARKWREEAEYQQRQAEQYREWYESNRRQNEFDRQQARNESQSRYTERLRQADNWRESIARQRQLFQAETTLDTDTNTYFGDGTAALNRALQIWDALAPGYDAAIADLQREIDRLVTEHRTRVGEQLVQESDAEGWRAVAGQLADPDTDMNDWLDW